MHDGIDPVRLTRPRRAHLLAAALLVSVFSVTGCTGSSGTTARDAEQARAHELADAEGRPVQGVVTCAVHGGCHAARLDRAGSRRSCRPLGQADFEADPASAVAS